MTVGTIIYLEDEEWDKLKSQSKAPKSTSNGLPTVIVATYYRGFPTAVFTMVRRNKL